MPNAASYDIHLRQGNSLTRTFRFLQDDGSPVDLTGSVLAFRAQTGVGETFISKTTPSTAFAMPDPASGEVTLTLAPNETALLFPGRVNRYEIERRTGATETTLVSGFIFCIDGVNDNG